MRLTSPGSAFSANLPIRMSIAKPSVKCGPASYTPLQQAVSRTRGTRAAHRQQEEEVNADGGDEQDTMRLLAHVCDRIWLGRPAVPVRKSMLTC
eukprot:5059734-Pyramimonas_sp.AAC.1